MADSMEFAFPHKAIDTYDGLTKREYFAAKAMQGILTNPSEEYRPWGVRDIAGYSVQIADALIAELSKEAPDAKR